MDHWLSSTPVILTQADIYTDCSSMKWVNNEKLFSGKTCSHPKVQMTPEEPTEEFEVHSTLKTCETTASN